MLYHLLLLLIVLLPATVESEDGRWRFVVMGDTRDRTTETRTGISPVLHRMAEAIAAEAPDLVVHTGDLCNGYYTSKDSPVHGKYVEQFRNWKAAMKPVYDYEKKRGIPVYPVRGNHEDGELLTNPALKRAYEEEFAAFLPQNGPDREKGLTYAVRHREALFLALDEYEEKKDLVLRGYVNRPWVAKMLAGKRPPFVFALCHTPAYQVGTYHQSPFPNLYSHPEERDLLWQTLRTAETTAFFCGHIHFYSRGTVDGIEQIVLGNGGADTVAFDRSRVDAKVRIHYPRVPYLKASDVKPGYLVATVDEGRGTVTGVLKVLDEETGAWKAEDSFTLPRPTASPTGKEVVGNPPSR